MKRAVIVGCMGQDGRILWDQLVSRGFAVVGIHRNGVRAHAVDWSDPIDIRIQSSVRRFIEQFLPDQIYYLAAYHQSSQQPCIADTVVWNASLDVHVQSFVHFLEACKAIERQPRVFYASSSRVFGMATVNPQTEETKINPTCIYGITKATGMMLARFYRKQHGVRVSCGILYNHESPIRGSDFLSQRVVEGLAKIKCGRTNTLEIGSLDARVDWGYAPDYTRAMQLILESDSVDDFVIASGETHTVRELIQVASDHINVDWSSAVIENSSILSRPSQELRGDAKRLRDVTGWKPSVGFSQMVQILSTAAVAKWENRTSG